MEKLFETAIRNKFRFPYKGLISVEDLWDLNIHELDNVFKTLNAAVTKSQEESLLAAKSEKDEVLTIQIEIVKYIVGVKLAEIDTALRDKERYEKKQRIMELIAAKQDEALLNKSVDELQSMLNDLD